MRDPVRLEASGDASEFERRLLRSASGERPPIELVQRMRGALGLPPGAGAAAGGGALGVAKGSWLAWGAAGALALGLGGGWLGARLFRRMSAPTVVASSAGPAPADPPPPSAPPADVAPAPASAGEGAVTASGSLRDEIALIDSARWALAARMPDRALDLLRRYGDRFPRGTLAPESIALRIEALEQGGRHREAAAAARRFRAAYPDSPLVERIIRVSRGTEAP